MEPTQSSNVLAYCAMNSGIPRNGGGGGYLIMAVK